MLFATYKLFGGIFCFIANLFIMLRSESIDDVIKDFISVVIISQIDDWMATTMKGNELPDNLKLQLTVERDNLSDK